MKNTLAKITREEEVEEEMERTIGRRDSNERETRRGSGMEERSQRGGEMKRREEV